MSMDFVYDLTEKLQEQDIDYFLITIRKGNKKNAADIFCKLKDEESRESLIRVFRELSDSEVLLKDLLEEENTTRDTDDTSNEKKSKKKPRKRRGRPRKKKGDDEE
jgi:nitrogen regulatory protein PII-like uncharacterized protein